MQPARVIGRADATIKHESLRGRKMLVVQPLMADRSTPDGYPLLVVDETGAGLGETVVITSDGRGARELLATDKTPVRWTTLGIEDE
jgi:ethanolamine utilization protein EutN